MFGRHTDEDGFVTGQARESQRQQANVDDDGFVQGTALSSSLRGNMEREKVESVNSVDNEGMVAPKYEGISYAIARVHFSQTLPKRISYPQSKTGFRLAAPGEDRSADGEPAKIYPNPFGISAEELDEFGN